MTEEFETLEVWTSRKTGFVTTRDGAERQIPQGWALLAPGDAALSRRIKKDGPTWTVKEQKGRKVFSRGIWAPADRIEALRTELEGERQNPSYQKKLDASRLRREKDQTVYATDFESAVFDFLNFHPVHESMGRTLARAIAAHAVPVGSGTVARTKRIPIEQRAEAATIAWMRHQTTAYDDMKIPRVKGKRREVRRMLAARSRDLLDHYRKAAPRSETCPLAVALSTA